jgi:hypothetical protein
MILFLIGVFVGAFFGVVVMGLCAISGKQSRLEEQREAAIKSVASNWSVKTLITHFSQGVHDPISLLVKFIPEYEKKLVWVIQDQRGVTRDFFDFEEALECWEKLKRSNHEL